MHTIFTEGVLFPPTKEMPRIEKYKETELMMDNKYEELAQLFRNEKKLIIAMNLAPLIIKKSADFLVGGGIQVSSTNKKNEQSQQILERIREENKLDVLSYELATEASKKGDAFALIRYGQKFGGEFSPALDKYRVHVEILPSEYIYPVTSNVNASIIVGYYYAVPMLVKKDKYILKTAYYATGEIHYCDYHATVVRSEYITSADGSMTPTRWKIGKPVTETTIVKTGIDAPLIVHVKNPLPKANDWQGTDDLEDVKPLLDEINNRLTQMSDTLNKHEDPMMAVPVGSLTDEMGRPRFRVASTKVMEVEKGDIMPQYISNSNPLMAEAKDEIEMLTSKVFMLAEMPELLLGASNTGTSGSSGSAIDKRLQGVYAKSRRKRQYFTDSLKEIYLLVQKLENALQYEDYEITIPKLIFDDEIKLSKTEDTNIKTTQVQNKLLSRKTAIMRLHNYSEEEALEEMRLIQTEEQVELNAIRTYDPSKPEPGYQVNYNKKVGIDEIEDGLTEELAELGFI